MIQNGGNFDENHWALAQHTDLIKYFGCVENLSVLWGFGWSYKLYKKIYQDVSKAII